MNTQIIPEERLILGFEGLFSLGDQIPPVNIKKGAIMKIKMSLLAILSLLLFGCKTAPTANLEPLSPNDPALSSHAAGVKKAQD